MIYQDECLHQDIQIYAWHSYSVSVKKRIFNVVNGSTFKSKISLNRKHYFQTAIHLLEILVAYEANLKNKKQKNKQTNKHNKQTFYTVMIKSYFNAIQTDEIQKLTTIAVALILDISTFHTLDSEMNIKQFINCQQQCQYK